MNFEEKVHQRVRAYIGQEPVVFTTNSESTSENLTKIISQNNWLIAGIIETETLLAKETEGCPPFSKENLKMMRVLSRTRSFSHMPVTATEYVSKNFRVPKFAWK